MIIKLTPNQSVEYIEIMANFYVQSFYLLIFIVINNEINIGLLIFLRRFFTIILNFRWFNFLLDDELY